MLSIAAIGLAAWTCGHTGFPPVGNEGCPQAALKPEGHLRDPGGAPSLLPACGDR